jgi:hypothetical protein
MIAATNRSRAWKVPAAIRPTPLIPNPSFPNPGRSVARQYLHWLFDVVRGDLGRSFHDSRPVGEKILERENEYLRDELRSVESMEELIGPSAALARIRDQIAMVAPLMQMC